MSDLWIPPAAEVDDRALRDVRAAVESAPPSIRGYVASAAEAELNYRAKQLRRKAARIARKSRKANRKKH